MNQATVRFIFDWMPDETGGSLLQNIIPFAGNKIALGTESVTVSRDGSAIVVTLPDMTQAVFQLP